MTAAGERRGGRPGSAGETAPRRFFRANRSLRFTRDGWLFLAVTMAIGFASLNTGHNLFYLVFAMQVSLIVVSGLLSEVAVRSLRVERRLPREIFARAATAVEIAVENTSRRRTIYAVELHDGVAGEPRRKVAFVDRLEPGGQRSFHSVWSFDRRGRYEFRSLHIVTRFPFGLFEKIRILPAGREVVVFPAIDRSRGRNAATDPTRAALRKNRLGEEMIGLRRKLHDDDPRHIHWRVSARAGELMVKEPGEALHLPLAIFFDSRGPAGPAFETAVERAATLVWMACEASRRVSFYAWDFEATGVSADSWHSTLGYLAEVEPTAAVPSVIFDRWAAAVTAGGGGVFITAGTPPALPPGTVLRVA